MSEMMETTQFQQTQQSLKKKPVVNLNLQTDPTITHDVVPAINSLESSSNQNNMQGIDGIDPNGFDGYGLSLDELNLLYSPTFDISPSEFNMNNGDFGGHNDSGTLSALPSATNSLSGGLKPLSDEEEANDHKTAEELVKKSDSVSDSDKKVKRKYTKRTKRTSIFSFDGFDNISQDSPNSSVSSAMSPSPTNKNNKDNFLVEASSTSYTQFDPRMMMQFAPGQVFDQSTYQTLPNSGSTYGYGNMSMGADPSGSLSSLLSSGLSAPSQGYYPNPNHNPNLSPTQFAELFPGQNFPPAMNMMQPMLQDALQSNRYFPLANGMKNYPMNYGNNYMYGGQLGQNPLLNQLTGQQLLSSLPSTQFHPNMFLPGNQLPNGVSMLPNALGNSTSNTTLPFMSDNNLELFQGREVGNGESDAAKSNKPNFQKSDVDVLDDFMSITALEMLSIQMEGDQQQQQQFQQQQQQLLLSQKAQLMHLAAQHKSYLDMQAMIMNSATSTVAAPQTASTSTSKRRSKITAQPSTKGKAAKGETSSVMIKTDCSTHFNDDDEDYNYSPEKFIGQIISDHSHNSHGHSGALIEMATMAMITGTSIKSTSRANNSLSTLSRRFVEHYGDSKTVAYISGQLNVSEFTESPVNSCRVDGAAETMNVHVRRIYELIKILEILSLIEFTGGKRGKFSWKGTKDFVYCLGCLQNDAISKFPAVAMSSGLAAVTAETTETLLPSINKLHINALNAQATAYTADLLLNMKSNSPTNSSTLVITNQLNQSLSQQQSMSAINASMGIAGTADSEDSDDEPNDGGGGGGGGGGGAASTGVFAMLPPTGSKAMTLKPKRVVNADVAMEEEDGEGLVAMGKVSFEGGRIDIPSGSDSEIPATKTPVVKLSEDGSSTKKRSKEATPRKISKTKQPDFDQALLAAKQQQGSLLASGSASGANTGASKNAVTQSASYATYAGDHSEHFMMETICRNFLQLFLVGMNSFTMSFAVHTLIPMQENEQLDDYNKKNATKIRRVYDIANVLCSLNIVQKKHIPRAADLNSSSKKKDQKAEMKVMVWGSYSPLVIRQHFLRKSD